MIVNFGSLNVDYVYQVDHFVRPGETLAAAAFNVFAGGKGANQSVALARAGASVMHAGRLGRRDTWLRDKLAAAGVDPRLIELVDGPSGHAIIQVNRQGENSIVLFGGANQTVTPAQIRKVMARARRGDVLLLQNEINDIAEIMRQGAAAGLLIALNPAPMSAAVKEYPLDLVDTLIVNEIEAEQLLGGNGARLKPGAELVLTLGARGARYEAGGRRLAVPAEPVHAVDTTAAGDTFIGYFLAARAAGADPEAALRLACRAAAVCVTRPGAMDSIPLRAEVVPPAPSRRSTSCASSRCRTGRGRSGRSAGRAGRRASG